MSDDWQETVQILYDKMRTFAPGIAAATALEIIETRHSDLLSRNSKGCRAEPRIDRIDRLLLEIASTVEMIARRTPNLPIGVSLAVEKAVEAYRSESEQRE